MILTAHLVGRVVLDRYRIEAVLGQGGMGIVVAARHVRLGERVAIKFPTARVADRADVVSRLVREGRAAMQIQSEHAAKVHDVGVLESGEPYLVMEYLSGRDLSLVIAEEGPLPLPRALDYLLQALEALAEAHARGIIHRDIKPSNLFLSRRADGSPLVKLIDFGISKFTSQNESSPLTQSAGMLGSVPYMAPEQMRSARGCSTRTDIWSLGATLHALLSGAPPFTGSSVLELYENLLKGPPSLRGLRPELGTEIEHVLARCMHRDPGARFADVAELAWALADLAPGHARISAERAHAILHGAPLADESVNVDTATGPAAFPLSAWDPTAAQRPPSWGDGDDNGLQSQFPTGTVRPVESLHRAGSGRWDRSRAARRLLLGGAALAVAALAWVEARTGSVPAPASRNPAAVAGSVRAPNTPELAPVLASAAATPELPSALPLPARSVALVPTPPQRTRGPAAKPQPKIRDPLADPD